MAEKLVALIQKSAQNDDTAFAALVKKYDPLIQSMSSRYFAALDADEAVLVTQQDFVQEAQLALYRAVRQYDPGQTSVSFGLYAKICIRNALVSQLRKIRSKKRKKVKISETVSSSPDFLRDLSESEQTGAWFTEIQGKLSPYEDRVLRMYLRTASVKQIAAALGRSEKSVSNAMYRIRTKAKELCNS